MLSELGVSKEFIFSESFANALTENISEEQSTAKVSFSTSKKQVTWLPEKPLTLLELAEENGLEPAFSCRNGQCGLCETEIINGDVNYVIQPATKVAEKKVLLCCSIPKGNVELQL
jgi:ferredoxin